MERRPLLVVNPRDDDEFVQFVEQMAGALSSEALQAALRGSYPLVVVHERELSAEPRRVWYVYRDGHWIRPSGPLNG